MKSSNDIYHGDEHITDKPKQYVIQCTEIVDYEVYVDAFDENEAHAKAIEMVTEQPDNFEVTRHSFQIDKIDEE